MIRRPGYVLVYGMPMSEKMMDKVKNGIDQQLHRLIEEGITGEELKIVKKESIKKEAFPTEKYCFYRSDGSPGCYSL